MLRISWDGHHRVSRVQVAQGDRNCDRGGTEPLAALVSVAAICVALSVYAGVASVTLSESGDGTSQVDGAVIDSVWGSVNENGVVDSTLDLEGHLGPQTLPRGYRTRVHITIVGDDGHLVTVATALFDERGISVDSSLEAPPDVQTNTRPMPVRIRDGDIRPGRLTVEVWDA